MTTTSDPKGGIFRRLDRLNEFERQPVSEEKLHGGSYFAGAFAGEHLAATEFVIGALFVVWGAKTSDILVGLLVGNLLAVLSWTLICAPIAVKTRLTLYWYLRKITGPVVMVVYNVLNAVLYCILGGCMITVAASAVRIPFGIEPQTGWLPTDPWFVLVVVVVGAVVVTLAILGFKRLAQFASVCSPWMLIMFVAGALVLLPQLAHIGSMSGLRRVAREQIWTGPAPSYTSMDSKDGTLVLHFDHVFRGLVTKDDRPPQGFFIAGEDKRFVAARASIAGQTVVVSSPEVAQPVAASYAWPWPGEERPGGNLHDKGGRPVAAFRTNARLVSGAIGFWHIVAFAWICNLAMHVGLSDMAILRYARHSCYGLYSAFGMFLGHYVAWICAGIMGAAAATLSGTLLVNLDSGEVAFAALGWMGALAVVVAGWTTANPMLYRSGLALQVVTPGWPRWLVTLLAGVITIIVACFPFVFRHLLSFVAIYGILLMPVGVIVVVEHWIFPRIGFTQFWTARKGKLLNWPALVSWCAGLLLVAGCWGTKVISQHLVRQGTMDREIEIIHEYFLFIPVWILTAVVYILLSALAGARQSLPELEEEAPAAPPPARGEPKAKGVEISALGRRMYYYSGSVALLCLALCLFFSICVFQGYMASDSPVKCLKFNDYLSFKNILIVVTAIYFISGVIWMSLRERRNASV